MAQNNFVDFDQAKALANKIAQRLNEQSAGLIFKGSKTFATLPSTLTQAMAGYVYNMSESFTTDSRFVEGSGKTYPAGTNVAVADCSTYEAVVDPSGDPSSQDWYELVNNKYVLSTDTEVDPSKTYYVGTISMKFDVASGFIDVESINDRIDDVRDDVAEQFSTSGTYKAGDIVMHNDLLYKFKTDHSAGAWNSAEVDATNIASELSENQNALTAGDHITIDDGEIAVNRYAIPSGDIVYKVLTGDYNSGNTVYVDKYESNGTFIERVTASPSGYQSQDVDGFIRIYKEWNRWEITLLEDCKEQSAGYNYSVAPHNAVTENDFTFTVEQQLDDDDLMTRGDVEDVTGDLSNLTTTAKTNLVAAINEVNTSSSLTAGDYIEIDGNEISVNPVVPNENVTYEFKTKDTSSSDATVTLIKKSGDTVISSTDYRYESVMGNKYITVDDLFYFGYFTTFTSGSNWGYKLLVASEDHAVDYTRSWGYNDTVDYTENFTSIDHSGESLVLKAQMDTALAGKQDTLTFDSVPTDGSTNPVESNGVYDALATKANASDVTDALALKQDKTDNTLQTTSKTVVGAVNELKSGLTNLDNEVNGDATVYPYADVITIPDAVPANLADCTVKIEPVQDLHGYDKPWVGGAWKNQFDKSLITSRNRDKRVSTNRGGTYYQSDYTATGYIKVKPNTVYTLSGSTGTTYAAYGDSNKNYVSGGAYTFGVAFRTPQTAEYIMFDYYGTDTATDGTIQLEEGDTATSYAPYENICPITGHTEASVEVTDGDETTKTYTIALGDTIYGGTVRIDSSGNTVMDVDRAIATVNDFSFSSGESEGGLAKVEYKPSNLSTNRDKCLSNKMKVVTPSASWTSTVPCFTVSENSGIRVYYDGDTLQDFQTDYADIKIIYELTTPFTVQLTPQQIQLLKGTNTLTASTGQISVTVNGVSGSIGAVQEQVNGLAEKIGENQIYSDTPVQIGTVGDKPLYRLFVTFETPISSVDNAYTSTGINSEDIELILRGDGINADGTYYGHLAFDPTFNEHQAIGVKGTANIKYAVIEYI